MKIPERVDGVVSQISSELLLKEVPQQKKNMFKVDKKGIFQECNSRVFMISLESIFEVCGGV